MVGVATPAACTVMANTVGWPSTVKVRLTLPAVAGAVKVIVSPLMLAVPALAATLYVLKLL